MESSSIVLVWLALGLAFMSGVITGQNRTKDRLAEIGACDDPVPLSELQGEDP